MDALRSILADVIRNPWQVEPVTGGKSGSRLFRVRPGDGKPVIVKLLRMQDVPQHLREDYPAIAESEYRFCVELMPRLGLPGPEMLRIGHLPDGTCFLVMEDLSVAHFIPPEGHVWSDRQLRSVVRTYGLLHGRSRRLFREEPVPDWLHPDPRVSYHPDRVLGCIRALAVNAWTAADAGPVAKAPQLNQLVRTVASALSNEPSAVLYNDFYPPNVALPADDGPAKLFDWQLVGTGPVQVDMHNIGLLGRDQSFAQVDRAALLDLYLDTLAGETGHRLDTGEFRASCRHAALLGWGVFMPRMVKAMEKCNTEGRHFSPWMAALFRSCMTDWAEALAD